MSFNANVGDGNTPSEDEMPKAPFYEVIGGSNLASLKPRIAEMKAQGWRQRRIHSGTDLADLVNPAFGMSGDGWSEKAKRLYSEEGAEVIVIFEEPGEAYRQRITNLMNSLFF